MTVPAALRWSGVIPLTVAWVPTGMKAGVSTVPCGVIKRPRRAAEAGSWSSVWNRTGRDKGAAWSLSRKDGWSAE